MKLEVLLLRHGQTQGNLEKRYIGKTDEPLLLDDTESMRKISALQKRLEQDVKWTLGGLKEKTIWNFRRNRLIRHG